MTLMPGGWSTAVEHSTGSSWAEAVKQVKGLGAVVTGMLLPYADLLAPSKFEKLSPHLHSNPALLTACASCCPCQHPFFFFSPSLSSVSYRSLLNCPTLQYDMPFPAYLTLLVCLASPLFFFLTYPDCKFPWVLLLCAYLVELTF